MSKPHWANVSYLDAIRPDPGWKTEYAFLSSYSADLIAMVAALLALAGLDDDRGSGSKVDFVNAVEQLKDKVRLVVQAGRLVAPTKTPKILAIMDRYVREANLDETVASWHSKAVLVKQLSDDADSPQWRLWIGSRNLTRDLSWDVGLSLIGRVSGTGTEIPGIPEMGHILARHANLQGISPGTVRSELRHIKWDAPSGCEIRGMHLLNQESQRELPPEPENLKKLIVVSPFLDGTVVGKLAKWGDVSTKRILLSSRQELTKLAAQKNKPLGGYDDLLFLDAPIYHEQAAGEISDLDNNISQDEEPESRGLHAKLIYAEGARQRLLWVGSANATQRGWNGPNIEIMAELNISQEVASGLEDFIKLATTIKHDELRESAGANPIDEKLEAARKQVVNSWKVTQKSEKGSQVLSNPEDPNPTDTDIQLSVELLGNSHSPSTWLRGMTEIRLPNIAIGNITELVYCRLTLKNSSIAWLQRAPINPSPSEERDRQAIARYLDPRTFFLWIRSLLGISADWDGSGDWNEEKNIRSQHSQSRFSPTWWVPTIEEVLKAWNSDPSNLVLIDKKVRYYLELYQEQKDIELTEEERKIIEEFHKTWQILRRELVPGVA